MAISGSTAYAHTFPSYFRCGAEVGPRGPNRRQKASIFFWVPVIVISFWAPLDDIGQNGHALQENRCMYLRFPKIFSLWQWNCPSRPKSIKKLLNLTSSGHFHKLLGALGDIGLNGHALQEKCCIYLDFPTIFLLWQRSWPWSPKASKQLEKLMSSGHFHKMLGVSWRYRAQRARLARESLYMPTLSHHIFAVAVEFALEAQTEQKIIKISWSFS